MILYGPMLTSKTCATYNKMLFVGGSTLIITKKLERNVFKDIVPSWNFVTIGFPFAALAMLVRCLKFSICLNRIVVGWGQSYPIFFICIYKAPEHDVCSCSEHGRVSVRHRLKKLKHDLSLTVPGDFKMVLATAEKLRPGICVSVWGNPRSDTPDLFWPQLTFCTDQCSQTSRTLLLYNVILLLFFACYYVLVLKLQSILCGYIKATKYDRFIVHSIKYIHSMNTFF